MQLYLIPGLGTDRRLFSRLHLPGHELIYLEWPRFRPGSTLADMAREMRGQVDAGRPHIFIGVSMGGMVAQELAVLTAPQQVVLISSITGPSEMPLFLRFTKRMWLHHLITDTTVRLSWPMRRHFGVRDREISQLLSDMAIEQGGTQIRRGTDAILRWTGSRWTGPVTRIHGDADHVLPLRFPVDHVVAGAPHTMVITRAEEVAGFLLPLLDAVRMEVDPPRIPDQALR
jgi:pimeloyl-ACP methyl ester carboxylesterase